MAALRLVAIAVAAVLAAGRPDGAESALFFFFEPTAAKPGDRVVVRTAGTPRDFDASRRVRPLQRPMRVYLVENAIAEEVRSRFDSRLHFVGSLRTDATGRGALSFIVPPLDSGTFAAAVWCPGCARNSRGRTFSVLGGRFRSRYRPLMLLRVTMPTATEATCPVTRPNGKRSLGGLPRHGNRLLWTGLPRDGVAVLNPDRAGPDSSIFWTKQIWIAKGIYAGGLEVQAERLDAPAQVLRLDVVSGHLSGWSGPSWAARMRFASPGCWKVTGRVDDVSLSFVVQVVVRPAGG